MVNAAALVDAFDDLNKFIIKHQLRGKIFFRQGLFIVPKAHYHWYTKNASKYVPMPDYSFLDIINRKHLSLVTCVRDYLWINNKRIDEENPANIVDEFSVLFYLLTISTGGKSPKQINLNKVGFLDFERYITRDNIRKAYVELVKFYTTKYAMVSKEKINLTEKEAINRIVIENPEEYHKIGSLFNDAGLCFLGKSCEIFGGSIKERLKTTRDHIMAELDRELEAACISKKEIIRYQLRHKFNASDVILVDLDFNPKIKDLLHAVQGLKIPDLLYLDSSGMAIVLDAKYNLPNGNKEQISQATAEKMLLHFKEYIHWQ